MGASHPVPDKWEPFQDQFSDSAPEVPPTFLTCTKARLVCGYQAFEFLETVLHDIKSSWVRRVSTLDDVKISSVAGKVVGNAGRVDVFGLKGKLGRFPLELRTG